MCGLVAFVCEGFQQILLEYGRAVRNLEQLEEALNTEMEFIHSIEMHVRDRLNSIIGDPSFPAAALKSHVVDKSHIACCYMRKKFIGSCYEYPWKLALGDTSSKLDDLMNEDGDQQEPVAFALQALLRLGYNKRWLLQSCQLLNDIHWSTTMVEDQHGSSSLMKRFHPDLGDEHLALWSFLHVCRSLF